MRLNEFSKEQVSEYGMTTGSPTPTSAQGMGTKAKSSSPSITTTNTSPTQQKSSPSINGSEPPASPVIAQAKELEVDFEYPDEKGNVIKVVSPIGQGTNKNAVVVQNQKTKEFYTLDPTDKIALPQVDQVDEDVDEIIGRRKEHLGKKIGRTRSKLKRLIRASKFDEQVAPIFELNFNKAATIKSALDAPIQCGFEAETVWPFPDAEDEDGAFLDDLTWNEILDLVWEQDGRSSSARLETRYMEWATESDEFYSIMDDLIADEVNSEKETEYWLNKYADEQVSFEEADDYKNNVMRNLEADKDEGDEDADDEYKERLDWDDEAWAREYIENNQRDYEDWLRDEITNSSDFYSDAFEKVQEVLTPEDWMQQEHGTWASLLADEEIYLVNEDASNGLEDVERLFSPWAQDHSRSDVVRTGSYHSGQSVDNDYWRIEDDSSIESDSDQLGAEIISPVYDSPREMLQEMNSLFKFFMEEGVETNSSTGLHVTMSMTSPGGENVNRLKLALLLGDQYVLKQFNRDSNTYTKSQYDKLQSQAVRMAQAAQDDGVDDRDLGFATLEKTLERGIDPGKFTSINFKSSLNQSGNQLIEFRIAGGSNYHKEFDKVAKSVVRYAATLQSAYNPEADKRDYVKAVSKVLTQGKDPTGTELMKHKNTSLPQTPMTSAAIEFLKQSPNRLDMVEVLSQAYHEKKTGKTDAAQKMFSEFMQAIVQFGRKSDVKLSSQMVRGFRSGFKEFSVTPEDLLHTLQRKYYHNKQRYYKDDADVNPVAQTQEAAAVLGKLLMKKIVAPEDTMYTIRYNFNQQTPMIRQGAYHDRQGNKKEVIRPEDIKVVDRNDHDNLVRAYQNLGKEGTPEAEQAQQYIQDFQKKYGFQVPKDYRDTNPNSFIFANSTDGELSRQLIDNGINLVRESAFNQFDKLPLQEQLQLLSKIDKNKINEAHKKTQESALPDHNVPDDFKELMSKPLLAGDIKRQMEAYFILPDPAMLLAFRQQRATAGDDTDLRSVLKNFAQRQLDPAHQQQIKESRGVTARQPGEQYVNNANQEDVLTVQDITSVPDNAEGFESREDLDTALDTIIPKGATRVNDNMGNSGSKAAIIALMIDKDNKPQYWVRYLRAIPPQGITGTWKTLNGYKYTKGAAQETLPLKPTDVLPHDRYLSTTQIANNVKKSVATQDDSVLEQVMNDAVKYARTNSTAPIKNGAPYFNVVQKYAGEYLGPLALIDGGNTSGDTTKMLSAYGLKSLKGSKTLFPGDTAYELVDSVIQTPNGDEIGVSSKAHGGGGAASSLSGISKQLTPEIEQAYPVGSEIIHILGQASALEGPLKVAQMFGIISARDVNEVMALGKQSKNLKDIKSPKLRKLVNTQGIGRDSLDNPGYRILYHVLTAIVNTIVPVVNQNAEFTGAMKAALNNNNFVQLMTKGKKIGNDITLDYYTKYPAVFEGSPKLYNKSYFATGQKGRLGFKLLK